VVRALFIAAVAVLAAAIAALAALSADRPRGGALVLDVGRWLLARPERRRRLPAPGQHVADHRARHRRPRLAASSTFWLPATRQFMSARAAAFLFLTVTAAPVLLVNGILKEALGARPPRPRHRARRPLALHALVAAGRRHGMPHQLLLRLGRILGRGLARRSRPPRPAPGPAAAARGGGRLYRRRLRPAHRLRRPFPLRHAHRHAPHPVHRRLRLPLVLPAGPGADRGRPRRPPRRHGRAAAPPLRRPRLTARRLASCPQLL
jgi:hypothetical protein